MCGIDQAMMIGNLSEDIFRMPYEEHIRISSLFVP